MLNGKFVFRPTWENRQSTTIPVVNLEELVFTMRTFECHIYYTYDTVTHNILANIGQHKHARSVCDWLLCVLFRKNAREKCPDQTNAVWKLRSFWDLVSIYDEHQAFRSAWWIKGRHVPRPITWMLKVLQFYNTNFCFPFAQCNVSQDNHSTSFAAFHRAERR